MLFQGDYLDGSWDLTILVTDVPIPERQVEKTLRVKGDLHIGGVMFRLVEALEIAMDWSDHALWWPDKNMWLKHTRSTLDQCGVQADAKLQFTPMHKIVSVQLPDLQVREMRVDFSVDVFKSIIQVSKELGIRHPEELSFHRKLEKEDLKRNNNLAKGIVRKKKRDPSNQNRTSNGSNLSNNSGNLNGDGSGSPYISRSPATPSTPQGTLLRTPGTPGSSPWSTYNGTMSPSSVHSLSFVDATDYQLVNSPLTPTRVALDVLPRPKSFSEKARINGSWMDSSRSLYEQEIRENDVVCLRYKFFTFYDLNPKYDAIRINQIYGQAKWALISEEIDCTEEEMIMFAALQLQVSLQSKEPQNDTLDNNHMEEDDIDAALTDLQISLEGTSVSSPGDITHIPELSDYLKFFKPKKFTLKSFKRCWFTFKDTHVAVYKSKEDANGTALMRVNLKGCEVSPDVNITNQKYGIKLFVPSSDGMNEVWIRCDTEHQYARWMAACRLASKGKTMADSSYDSEVQSITAFLSMQHTPKDPVVTPSQINFNAEDFIAPRFLRKLKSKQLATKILEAHANVRHLALVDAKMSFIKACQALPEYGITYFIVKFQGSKKEELLGIASNRIMRMDLNSGDALKTWRYSTMKSWNVNWEAKLVIVDFEEEKVAFACLTADCKIIHEFIGGYIFCSMRSTDKNQALNEEMFHKLTGGWS
ncbi:fermitin family homolog 2-like [Tubulanus polymorphus]|uniref:fermitin family homolog 2-like n=1 Tax=Tubulanus polymorphus TaxID=672921 RepID=UPI003DA2EDE7